MAWNLYTVKLAGKAPSLEDAASSLGIPVEDLDQEFGLTLLNPDEQRFAIQLRSGVAPSTDSQKEGWDGPWSTPPISSF